MPRVLAVAAALLLVAVALVPDVALAAGESPYKMKGPRWASSGRCRSQAFCSRSR